jgi:Rrf2 family protein
MTAQEIATITQSPPGYMAKILQSLGRAGLVASQRGPAGGFRLIHDLDAISVLDVINAVDPLPRVHQCPLGLAAHADQLCSLHSRIDRAMLEVERSFGDTTIGDLLRDPCTSYPLGGATCPNCLASEADDTPAS